MGNRSRLTCIDTLRGEALTGYKDKLEVVGLAISKPIGGVDCDIGTLSKLNLIQQNRHENITFDYICQLRSAETDEFLSRRPILLVLVRGFIVSFI